MFYCDSSLIVSALTPEVHSAAASRWLRTQADGELAISEWVAVEVASALAMKVRRGTFSEMDRALALARWRAFAAGCVSFDIGYADWAGATTHVDCGPRGLRASDSLHLSIAARRGCAMATLDDDLAAASRAIGMAVASVRPELR